MATTMVFCYLSLIVCFVSVMNGEKVPVLMWSNSRPLSDLPQAYAGNSIESDVFRSKYLTPLIGTKGQNVVAFIQDKLHMEDFSKYADVYNPFSDGGAFKNIKALMDDHFSINLPAVHSPKSVVDSLTGEFGANVHIVSSPDHVAKLKLEKDKSYLLIVRLPPTSQGKEEAAIMKNDDKVGEIVKALNKRSIDYTAIFTGERSKRAVLTQHTGRHLLANPDNITGIWVNESGQIFFYSRNIQVIIKDSANPTDNPVTIDFPTEAENYSSNKTTFNNNTVYFQLQTEKASSNVSGLDYNVTFSFTAVLYADRWQAVNFTLFVSNKSKDEVVFDDVSMSLSDSQMELPPFFSYHCSDLMLSQENATGQYAVLRFDGLQFQPFGIENDQFSDAWDCVGFFTTPIWMGLVPVAIFTVILFCGMYMLAQLSTMDRFDDPKGKTITVNVNE